MAAQLRLDRYLATVTDLTRKQARVAIKTGQVQVAGVAVVDPSTHVAADAQVVLQGQRLRCALSRYFMLHKPVGYVCVNKDSRHPSVLELLDEDNRQQLHPAGRLDLDTTGLVLITDDGPWAHRVTSPNMQCGKTYLVETAADISPAAIAQFQRGMYLPGEKRRLQPAALEILAPRQARLVIMEGKYHQVKRMFQALDNQVVQLHRQQIGALPLDPALAPGEYRALTPQEVAYFR